MFSTLNTNFYLQGPKRLEVKKILRPREGRLPRIRWENPAIDCRLRTLVISLTPSKYPYSFFRGVCSVLEVRRT
jgi:hypothetical protein